MKRVLLGLLAYAQFALLVLAFLPILRVVSLVHRGDPVQRVPGRWIRRLGRAISAWSPLWRFSIDGEAPPDVSDRAYVVVSNHQSNADPMLLAKLPWDMRWVAKAELSRWPVLGWVFLWGGDIFFRRGHRRAVEQMMAACRQTLLAGSRS
ncbi:MAG: 1-acyl-sn-glycerol-3-phosphate acyltransferase [Myxococcales bacterium]|nr:1-acyl-sn-glycerol-3-phosphate acyltransferase [Myxococcales bacterium]